VRHTHTHTHTHTHKQLTSLLAPEALLCEWQIADSLGVAAFRDQDALFYLVDNSRSGYFDFS
jgi:hypothetical protein